VIYRNSAAPRVGLDEIKVIVPDLDDDAKLAFSGRDNMEDENADFLALLETWGPTVFLVGGHRCA
jgi:ParB-like chromosome segregation protein Spo0J